MKEKTIPIKMTIEVPRVPNFLKVKETETYVPLYALDEPMMDALGKAWTERLKERAKEQLEQDRKRDNEK